MKQVEITVMIDNNLDNIIENLTSQGFNIIRRSIIKDKYLSPDIDKLRHDNILSVLSGAVILRYLNVNDSRVITQITHKNKIYDNENNVLSVEAINLPCDDLEKAEILFNNLGFQTLVDVNYNVVVLSNNEIELAFQNVEGLGLMLECESNSDFTGKTEEEINQEKHRLINEIKNFGIEIKEIRDIKKAYELLKKATNE